MMNSSAKNATDAKVSPQDMLKQLAELDTRLQKLETFFAESKHQGEENSLFTEENIRKVIELTRQLDPDDIYVIQALKQFIPMARMPTDALKNTPVVSQSSTAGTSGSSPPTDSRRLHKLTNRIPQNRII